MNKRERVRRDGRRERGADDQQRAARGAEFVGDRAAPGRDSGAALDETQQQPKPAGRKRDAGRQKERHAAGRGGEGSRMYHLPVVSPMEFDALPRPASLTAPADEKRGERRRPREGGGNSIPPRDTAFQ